MRARASASKKGSATTRVFSTQSRLALPRACSTSTARSLYWFGIALSIWKPGSLSRVIRLCSVRNSPVNFSKEVVGPAGISQNGTCEEFHCTPRTLRTLHLWFIGISDLAPNQQNDLCTTIICSQNLGFQRASLESFS